MKPSLALSTFFVLAACAPEPEKVQPQSQPSVSRVGIANPASVYCTQIGGRIEIVTNKGGDQSGLCHLPDGTATEEWALFRRDHP